jgi:hypothetical protein
MTDISIVKEFCVGMHLDFEGVPCKIISFPTRFMVVVEALDPNAAGWSSTKTTIKHLRETQKIQTKKTKKKKVVRIKARKVNSRYPIRQVRDDLYYRYLNLCDLWGRYAHLIEQAGENPITQEKRRKAMAKASIYLHSAIELEEKNLEKEEKRREEAGEDDGDQA